MFILCVQRFATLEFLNFLEKRNAEGFHKERLDKTEQLYSDEYTALHNTRAAPLIPSVKCLVYSATENKYVIISHAFMSRYTAL